MKLLLDLDGVCVDFVRGMCELHNRPNPYSDSKNLGHYGLDEIWNMSKDEFFPSDLNNADWWEKLNPMDDLGGILEIIKKFFRVDDICVLSFPPKNCPKAMEGKLAWCHTYLPSVRYQLFGNTKNFCACQDTVLLDDDDYKIDVFRMNGGRAVTVPRPWNRFYDQAGDLRIIEEAFEKMFIPPISDYS
ncbi:MAG: hypothetical protein QQN63_02220 [Nitrosopumilus sp.]